MNEIPSCPICKVKDIATVSAGHPFRGKIPEDPNGDVLVVQAKDLQKNMPLDWAQMRRAVLTGRKSSFLQIDDILFLGRGNRFCAVLVSEVPDCPAVAAPHLFVIRIKEEARRKILPSFLVWQFNYGPLQVHFQANAFGTVQKTLRRKELDEASVFLPPLAVQEKFMRMVSAVIEQQQLLLAMREGSEKILESAAYLLPEVNKHRGEAPDVVKHFDNLERMTSDDVFVFDEDGVLLYEPFCKEKVMSLDSKKTDNPQDKNGIVELAKSLCQQHLGTEDALLYLLDLFFNRYKALPEQQDESMEKWIAGHSYNSKAFEQIAEQLGAVDVSQLKKSILYNPKTGLLHAGKRPFPLSSLTDGSALETLLDKLCLDKTEAGELSWQLGNEISCGRSMLQPDFFSDFAGMIGDCLEKDREDLAIYDPQCGNGFFLSFLGSFFREHLFAAEPDRVKLFGQEADALTFQLAIRAAFLRGDFDLCLRNERALLSPALDSKNKPRRFDCIASLSLNIFTVDGVQPEDLPDFARSDFPVQLRGGEMDFALLYQLLGSLKEGGTLVVLVPHRVLFQDWYRKSRKKLLEHNVVRQIIDLSLHSGLLSPKSSSPYAVMICRREKNPQTQDIKFWQCLPTLYKGILDSRRVSFEEIAAKDYILLPQPYITRPEKSSEEKKPFELQEERDRMLNSLSALEKEIGKLVNDDLSVAGLKEAIDGQQQG